MPGGRRSLRNRNKDRCPYKTQLSGASLRGGGSPGPNKYHLFLTFTDPKFGNSAKLY